MVAADTAADFWDDETIYHLAARHPSHSTLKCRF
jgi:hypothetical protein